MDPESSAPSTSARSNFESLYKNNGRTSSELRKRREDETIRIRKEKREETQNKRRHIIFESDDEMDAEVGSGSEEYEAEVFDPKLIDDLSSFAAPDAESRVHKALVFYRHLIQTKAVNEILELGLTTIFIDIIGSVRSPQLIYESLHIISEILCLADGNELLSSNPTVFDLLLSLLTGGEPRIQEVAASAVSNLACDCSQYCIDRDIIDTIVTLYHRNDAGDELKASLIWIARSLCKKKLSEVNFENLMHMYPMLVEELCRELNSDKVLGDAAMALALLGDQTDERISRVAVAHRRIMPRMITLMRIDQAKECREAAMRYVSNLASGHDAQTALVCEYALGSLRDILADCIEAGVRRDACWAISNIAASGRERIEELMKAGIFLPIVYVLESGPFDLRREAAWAVFNATQYGTFKHIAYLCKLNVHVPLIDLLTTVEWNIAYICLRSIRRMIEMGESDLQQRNLHANRVKLKLEEEGFRDRLDYLQNSDNKEVSREAGNIWKLFFEDDDDDDLNL
ncbi:hypothetical protein L596_011276 [Steinernema carpocapsae]|uniref:Importin subunit alpha n=1 Tax=Steinernema carpocapsae TaxID=34508 RepID=A0A4U5NTW7_STECR|nr:hypothetical protein L596_011276 [Steinernema carpocapsae]